MNLFFFNLSYPTRRSLLICFVSSCLYGVQRSVLPVLPAMEAAALNSTRIPGPFPGLAWPGQVLRRC